MKKIIVPIDFSKCSKNALGNAIKIAERMKLELILYHAVVLPVGFAEGAPVGGMDYGFEELEKEARKDLDSLIKEFPLLEKIKHQTFVQYGPLHEGINDLNEDGKVALVVMGTHGASGFAKSLIGSNAYNVMKHIACPVIALPEDADITKMTHIGIAGDFISVPNPDLIQIIIELAKAFYAQIHVVHIDKGEVDVKGQIDVARRMEKYLKHTNHTFHFRKFEDVEEGLQETAKELHIQLLAMIAKHHGFFDKLRHTSHTKQMILDIPMPLMVLHE
ncbi:universal stress protein [Roseivirga sp.]|uniref:universal stress protein n=1 Tax=Roseivirga sp. TaxID=1964215 RepID=UPI003B51DD32